MSFRNVASGNARVGMQVGQIHGNITVGSGLDLPADLVASLAELRGNLKQAHRDGQLDAQTYAAAQSELDAADECLQGESPHPGGVLVALKRLRGLVADVAGLAAQLATVIAVAKDLA